MVGPSQSSQRSPASEASPAEAAAGGERSALRPRVLKFGGTSVASAAALRAVVERVREARVEARPLLVVSALAGVTDRLVALYREAAAGRDLDRSAVVEIRERHRQLLGELAAGDVASRRAIDEQSGAVEGRLELVAARARRGEIAEPGEQDAVLVGGERLAIAVVAAVLSASGVDAVAVDASELLATDGRFGDADGDLERTRAWTLARLEREGARVIVAPGFFGAAREAGGPVALLGRGGSDTSATWLGVAMRADRVDIFTDVDGVYSADPRLVPSAERLASLSLDEAADLAFFGAKVLHRKCLAPLRLEPDVAVATTLRVAATISDGAAGSGTRVENRPAPSAANSAARVESGRVRGVAVARGVASVSIDLAGDAAAAGAELMDLLRELRAPVYHLAWSGSGPGATVVLPEAAAREVFAEPFGKPGGSRREARVTLRSGLAVVAAVGASIAWGGGELAEQFRRVVGGAGGYAAIFAENFPNVLLAVVDDGQATRIARAVHRRFVEAGRSGAVHAPLAASSFEDRRAARPAVAAGVL
jgi:aspartokinase/homoserine dehydrogenase 1